ncbi:MAG: glucose-6-phosphate isomerase [Akkermansiaceae bacterium]|jgi:glucose-6-phosphate isomerase|nr:glucose-6-phosphate isomerase [Akkermansiaceae bacterium]MDP4647802.1 glucose-6-phosphate isomerase [Akkermansiaceae bacterium]MDP4719630.1 glucose-6-phosphate isomerase [Akkermansiaceae bacterium]MDP4780877.1 glucose-6-phosphate isomerase [Akkermansiaceae bacterium]MDP4848594.1 glucose-6-phosphate isomerase [Akkermansiaceae bacterium]
MSWKEYNESLVRYDDLGFSLDLSLMDVDKAYKDGLSDKVTKAFADMVALESGAIANPDEGRMVGHYWLRNADLAPTAEIKAQITEPLKALKQFAGDVHTGKVRTAGGDPFRRVLLIGIGGSALGPQLVDEAIGQKVKLPISFFDNTDPQGMDDTLRGINLAETLVLVISKSGGTAETRNGMLEAKAAFDTAGIDFGKHAVAVTGEGSKLYNYAKEQEFIAIFPMEDWVGGRTSVLSTVGLVPAAIQGIDIDAMLEGAAAMDVKTRKTDAAKNAAMQLAIAWHKGTNGKGEKDMVVLPYKDSLVLFSKYLQQLLMESLGKEHDLDGNVVNQGIAVYGNKGSTDQHAYVQQLRDGVNNFFASFIEVRHGRKGKSIEVDPGNTAQDYLQGFLRGTRSALYESGRNSLTISIYEVTPFTLGMLIALFERAVSFYASLVNINAYHQPGVEAGKKAATAFLELLGQVRSRLVSEQKNAEQVAFEVDGDPEAVYHCLVHLANNGEAQMSFGDTPADDLFQL